MQDEIKQAYYLMGTIVELTLYLDSSKINPTLVLQSALVEFERIEKIFSYFDPSSELSRVNSQANNHPVKVSKEFFDVVSLALSYMLRSEETFSIMLAPLTKLWRKAETLNKIPNTKSIKELKKLTNPDLLVLDPTEQTIFFREQAELDLSGFVKGYAIDCVKKTLSKLGAANGIINAGTSSIISWGAIPNNQPWRLAVKHLLSNNIIAVLNLASTAISTSGTTEKFFTIKNKKFSHLLDPKTGYPLDSLISATVLCPSAVEAEVISKMLLFLGQEKTLECCEKNGWLVDSLLIQQLDKNNDVCLIYSDDLPIIF